VGVQNAALMLIRVKPDFMKKRVLLLSALILLTPLSMAGDKKQKITAMEFERLMQLVADGWNKGDARKAADCFTENAIYSEPPDKQLYKGRAELFRFFGGNEGRKSAMKMSWHHLVFNEQEQIGAGEFTFEFGSKVHGVAMIKVAEGKISHWREYWYESDLDWEKFIGENKF
jgi:SnoaL-like domain